MVSFRNLFVRREKDNKNLAFVMDNQVDLVFGFALYK